MDSVLRTLIDQLKGRAANAEERAQAWRTRGNEHMASYWFGQYDAYADAIARASMAESLNAD